MSKDFYTSTMEECFPDTCADHWVELLTEIRTQKNHAERERLFLFAHGFVCALAKAQLLKGGDKEDARELLIWARARSCPSPWPWGDVEKQKAWPPAQ